MNSKDLEDILKGCKKGKRRSQEMLYRQYSAKMFAVCLYYAGNKSEAEDFLHNGFIKVFDKINQYQEKGVFEAWMRRIFMHTALEKYRKKEYNLHSDDKEALNKLESNDNDVLSQLSANELMEIIQKLSPSYRLVFNLYAIEGYTHKEISELLGISEGTSKSNLSRARVLLQQRVNTHFQVKKKIG